MKQKSHDDLPELPVASKLRPPVETGLWRTVKPVMDREKCVKCGFCWMYCPDMAIPQKGGKRIETDYDFCKGCGICKTECMFGAITMEKEKK